MTNGRLLTIVGTDPAAGVEIAEVVPAGEIWEIQSIRIDLVTDATAVNREVVLRFGDGTSFLLRAGSNGVLQAASLTFRYFVAAWEGLRGPLDAAGLDIMIPIPRLILYPAHTINTATVNLQGADDFAAPIISALVSG